MCDSKIFSKFAELHVFTPQCPAEHLHHQALSAPSESNWIWTGLASSSTSGIHQCDVCALPEGTSACRVAGRGTYPRTRTPKSWTLIGDGWRAGKQPLTYELFKPKPQWTSKHTKSHCLSQIHSLVLPLSLFCLFFCLLYFFLLPFEDNGLLFWVPDVLCRHSEVLWNLLGV